MKGEASSTGIYVRLVVVAIVWGARFIAGRVVSTEMDAVTAALRRYVVATTALVAAALAIEHGLPRLSAKQWSGVVVLGILGASAYSLCFMSSLQTVSASRTSLIIALNPVATLIGGAMFLHEPLTRNRVLGIHHACSDTG